MIDKSNGKRFSYMYEAKMGIKRNKVSFIIIYLQCTICLVLIAVGYSNFIRANNSLRDINAYYEKIHYSLHDIADDGSYTKYINSEREYYNLKGFVEELRNRNDIDFIITILQPIDVINQHIEDKFFFYHEEGYAEPVHLEEINNMMFEYREVKSIQMSRNLKETFNLEMDLGNYFSKDDFILKEKPYCNVILGYEYKDYFNVDDNIKAEYLGREFNFRVIGFLKKDTNIVRNNNVINLDRYICMPAFTELNYKLFPDLATIALSQQANGQILTLNEKIDVAKIVEDTSNKYGTFKFEVYGDSGNESRKIIKLSDDVINKIRLMNNILIIFTIISITISLISRIQKDCYRFGVQLLCGASIYNILIQITIELFLVIGIAVISSFIINFMTMGFGVYQLPSMVVGFVMFLSSMTYPTYILIKKEANQFIGREE